MSRTSANTDSGPLSERDIRRSLRTNIAAGALGMWWAAATLGMPLPMLMESIGATGVWIGLVTTVRQLAMLAQVPGALYAEGLPSRRGFWALVSLSHRAVWFLPGILPWLFPAMDPRLPVLMVATVALSDLLANAGSASWFSWMADLIPGRTAGAFWGKRQSVLTASGLVAAAAMGWILDAFPKPGVPGGSYVGFSIVFALAATLGIADILLHLRVAEPRPTPAPRHRPLTERLIAPLRDTDFRRLTLAMGAWNFSVGLAGAFGAIYLKRDFGVTYTQLSWLFIAASLGAVLSGFVLGYLMDRLGARAVAMILMAAAPLSGLSWFLVGPGFVEIRMPGLLVITLPQPILVQLIAHLVAGAIYSGVAICQVRLATALAPAEGRTLAMAVHWSLIGLTAALGPVCGGLVMDRFDAHATAWRLVSGHPAGFFQVLVLLHLGTTWAVALPLMDRVPARTGDLPVGTALSRMILSNPLQSVRNLYTIYAASASSTSSSKVRAVRNLGHTRTALAVADLIRQLEDPDREVREAAIAALGDIGTEEAFEALLRKLDDPDPDLEPQLFRALRTHPAGVPHARRRLGSSDPETVAQAVALLGCSGDRSEAAALLDLLEHSTHSRVAESAADALARLAIREAIPGLFARLCRSDSPRRRASYALALARLLGDGETFYRMLVGEARERGAGLETVRDKLRRKVRHRHRPDLERQATHTFERLLDSHIEGDDPGARTAFLKLAELCPPTDPTLASLVERLIGDRQGPWDSARLLLALHLLLNGAGSE